MFWHKLRNAIYKPQKIRVYNEDKIIDSGLIAICIIFLQALITIPKPDSYQINSLVAFSIAIPMLSIHFFIIRTFDRPSLLVPAYLAKSFGYLGGIGFMSTGAGILFVLERVSEVAAIAFIGSSTFGYIVLLLVRLFKSWDKEKVLKEEVKQNPQ